MAAKRPKPTPPPATRPTRSKLPVPRLYMYFEAVIRHGSIRAAAESLRIASSALNRRVLDMERDLGTVLFDRLPNGVRLTAAGEIFAAHVRRTLTDARMAGEQILNLQGEMRGNVAIGSAESAAMEVLPQLIVGFQERHPATRFTISVGTPGEILADLLADQVDFILTHEEPEHHDVAILAAAKMPFCALMRTDHPLAGQPELRLADCQNFPIVLAQEQLAARALVDSAIAAGGLNFQPALVTNLFEVMKKYVRLTNAISFQFYLTPLGQAQLDGLVALPLADPHLAKAHLSLAVRRRRVLPASAAAVLKRLEALLRTAAG